LLFFLLLPERVAPPSTTEKLSPLFETPVIPTFFSSLLQTRIRVTLSPRKGQCRPVLLGFFLFTRRSCFQHGRPETFFEGRRPMTAGRPGRPFLFLSRAPVRAHLTPFFFPQSSSRSPGMRRPSLRQDDARGLPSFLSFIAGKEGSCLSDPQQAVDEPAYSPFLSLRG